jgi:Ran GTPase-activating protein (RanGAP) involved in mRNA processing and transport
MPVLWLCDFSQDQGAIALADALSTNNALVSLNLEGNNIQSEGASALAKGLRTNKSLQSLNLLNQR